MKIVKSKAKLGSGARFSALKGSVAKEYANKGKSPKEAARIGAAVAAKVGMEKYGKKKMTQMAVKAKKK